MKTLTDQQILHPPINNLLPLLKTAHKPLAWPFTLFDLGEHHLEEEAEALGGGVSDLGDFVTCERGEKGEVSGEMG